jgi:N-sulfoglucosamine sulfohydrolase
MNQHLTTAVAVLLTFCVGSLGHSASEEYSPRPLSKEIGEQYVLDASFYEKMTPVAGILIASSERVSDLAHAEAAYQFDMMMKSIDKEVAKRIREAGVLCILVAHDELTSDVPQFKSEKTGKELDYYNWRNRGFLTRKSGRQTVFFAEEDVLEYEGGMQLESILIHEFGHVIHGAGFSEEQQKKLTETFLRSKAKGIWNDGRAAQRFRRVKSETPVSLLDELKKWFPDRPSELLIKCLDSGDILVNGKPSHSKVKVTKNDKVLIVFGGVKRCYANRNRSEYFAEGVQCWYNTNRTMDQLIAYDPHLAQLCEKVLGNTEWRFVSPRKRAGTGHLAAFDPAKSPKVVELEHIQTAAYDYYDKYWSDFWVRLEEKHKPKVSKSRLNVLFITLDDMNWDSVGVFGSKVAETTPNIDRLASQGLRYEHAHVTIAICQPTRAVWMTGRYPHNSGALGFDPINRGVPTLPETLRENGYITGILGKTEHVIPTRKEAFDYRRGRDEMENGRSAKLYAKFAGEFLAQAKSSDKPFFFMVNTHDPHRPFDNRQPAKQRNAARAAALKKNSVGQAKPKGEKTKNGKPKGRKARLPYPAPSRIYQPNEIVVPDFLPDLPEIREEIAQYYSSVRRADDVVGVILNELKKAGFDGNTIVMLKSDHGIPVPFAKTNVWRNSTRTPWMVRWPGVVAEGTHDTEHLIAGVDFAPTIFDALGIKPPAGMDGTSFLPTLKGEKQGNREHVFTHINTIASKRSYVMRSVQTAQYGLIWNGWSDGTTSFRNESLSGLTWKAMVAASASDEAIAKRTKFYSYRVPMEFYDYSKDPDALSNLIDDPGSQQEIRQLTEKMLQYMKSTNDPQLKAFETTLTKQK